MTKQCKYCGTGMNRKKFQCGATESKPQFEKRQYCDKHCMGQASRIRTAIRRKRKRFIQDTHVMPDGRLVKRSNTQREARKYKGDSCEECGSTMNLHIHHINHEWWDNTRNNLMTLCSKCHMDHHLCNENPQMIVAKLFASYL
jgi:hypothetical protein